MKEILILGETLQFFVCCVMFYTFYCNIKQTLLSSCILRSELLTSESETPTGTPPNVSATGPYPSTHDINMAAPRMNSQ